MTDRELLAEYIRSGSAEALSAIIERHSALVYATCLRLVRDTHAAEDATQATFLIFMRRAKTLPLNSVLPGWLYATAQTTSRNLLRSASRRTRNERTARTMTTATVSDPAAATSNDELREQLDAALAVLPPAQRNAVILRYFYNHDSADAAQQLGCSPETLQVQLSRALSRMRDFLQRRGVTVSAAVLTGFMLDVTPQAPAGLAAAVKGACLGKAASAAAVALANTAGKSAASWLSAKFLVVAAVAALAVAAPVSYVYFSKPSATDKMALPAGSKILFEQHFFKSDSGWRGDPEIGKDAADDGKAIHSVALENAATNPAYAGEVRSPWHETGWQTGKHTYLRFRILGEHFTRDEQLKFMFKRGDQTNFSAMLNAPVADAWTVVTIRLDEHVVFDGDHQIKLPVGEMLHQLVWQCRSDATPPNTAARFWIADVVLFDAPGAVSAQALTEAR